jgi:hypothetical protein
MFYAFEEFGIIYAFRVQKNNKIECVLLFIIYNPINSKLYCVTFHNFIVSHFTILLCHISQFYCVPWPISIGGLMKSGSIVLKFQGPTYNWGFGGSERICKLALRSVWPMVSIPIWYPAFNKLMLASSPFPEGFNCAH